jgi:cytochrome c nitrite reductase small subunit
LKVKARAIATTAVLLGGAIGLAGYTFVYARGYSYMTDDPKACVNCHIMNEQYDGWVKGSHRSVATCNDCHTPPNIAGKYATKARNGFWHSFYFTTGSFHEPIRITPPSRKITEQACRNCHSDVVSAMRAGARDDTLSCLRCHASVGHMELGASEASLEVKSWR